MKNQKVWDKSISILVNAYLKNTLQHDDCAACAVGNLISASCGYEVQDTHDDRFWVDKKGTILYPNWTNVFSTYKNRWLKRFFTRQSHSSRFEPINTDSWINMWAKKTGYSLVQLANIERAFEIANPGKSEDDYMFNGLMNVVDVLMKIHEATPEQAQQAKELFTLTEAG